IGMDGYLTKPLRLEEVHAVLARFSEALDSSPAHPETLESVPEMPHRTVPDDAPESFPTPESPLSPPEPCSGFVERMLTSLNAQYELDREEAMPLIQSLAETLTVHDQELRTCLETTETGKLMHHAHGIKGLLLNMGLTGEGMAAKKLEDSAHADAASEDLRRETEALLLTTGNILAELRIALDGENT
ncbi:MAG: hypothetical protein CVU63_15805, partial [Deltaproteobacteria bacterium HGW-Deltaproteobacteria-20]